MEMLMQHDNTRSHIRQATKVGSRYLIHLLYSSDLTLSDFHIFLKLKKYFYGIGWLKWKDRKVSQNFIENKKSEVLLRKLEDVCLLLAEEYG